MHQQVNVESLAFIVVPHGTDCVNDIADLWVKVAWARHGHLTCRDLAMFLHILLRLFNELLAGLLSNSACDASTMAKSTVGCIRDDVCSFVRYIVFHYLDCEDATHKPAIVPL